MRAYRWYIPWLLVVPALVWVLVFALWPFLNTIVLSFTDARPLAGGSFVGLENYLSLLQDQRFWNALVTSLVYVVLCVPLLTFLPLLLAGIAYVLVYGIGDFPDSVIRASLFHFIGLGLALTQPRPEGA